MRRVLVVMALLVWIGAPAGIAAAEGDLDPSWTGPDGSDAGASIFDVSADGFFDQVLQDPEGALYGRISHGNNIAETSIVRFTASGAFDAAFDDGGVVHLGKGGAFDQLRWGRDLAIDASGRVLVLLRGGRLLRLLDDGAADTDFADGGIHEGLVDILGYASGEYGDFTDLHVDPADGSLWVAGWVHRVDGTDRNMVLVHLAADGSVDTGFAESGVFEYDADARYDQALSVRTDGGQRLWLAGQVTVGESATLKQGAVVALDRSGAVAAGFGRDGLALVDYGQPEQSGRVDHLRVHPDGQLLVAGSVAEGSALAGLDGDTGAPSGYRPDAAVPNRIEDLALRSDGSLVLVSDLNQRTVITRLLPDGSLDSSFGEDGRVTLRLVSNRSKTSPQSCLLDADGDLVVSGTYATTLTNGVFDPWIARLQMDPPAQAPMTRRRIRVALDREGDVRPELGDGTAGVEVDVLQWVFDGLSPVGATRIIVFVDTDAG